MEIGIVGSDPATDAVRAAFEDVDATVCETPPDDLAAADFGAVVAPAGADTFDRADAAADRWVAVEVGGIGGHPIDDVDAAVSVFARESGGYADLRARVAANGDGGADRPRGDRSAVRFAGAVAGRRAVAALAGADLGGTVVEVAGASAATERAFLPVPTPATRDRGLRRDEATATLEESIARAERALDDRVGAVAAVGERESFPVPYYLASTADTSGFSDARAAPHAAGVAVDWDRAFMKALGEGLERYCAGVYRAGEFTVAPETNLAAAVPPRRFVRPESSRPPDREAAIPWVDGEDLATGEAAALPAEFVHYPPPNERHKPAITTGLGLGNGGVEALLSGLYEVVERDATMLAWYSTFEPLGLSVTDAETRAASPDAVEEFEALLARARAERLEVTPLLVTQDVDVPVVAVAVHRTSGWPKFATGSAADLDAAAAAEAALAEALQNWMELRAMGPEGARAEEGAIGEYGAFPTAVRSLVDVDARVPAASVGPAPAPSGADELDAVVERVTGAGLGAYAARLTTRDAAALDFEAVRVLVPEAQPLFTGDPYFGERTRTVPRELGYEPRLDRAFHPYP